MTIPRALLLDIDGTLLHADAPIAGAVDAVRGLHARGVRIRYLTNTTRRPRAAIAQSLLDAGFPLENDALFTAPVAAARFLEAQSIRRVSLFVPDATHADFAAFERDDEHPEAIVVGDLGAGWTFEVMNRAFRALLDGARLVALHRNRYWSAQDGLRIDAGAFVAALEYAAGTEAAIVGKPSPHFFSLALGSLGVSPEPAVVVGDDVESDIAGGAAAGLRTVLVRTGKYRGEVARRRDITPDAVLDSIADVPAWWDATLAP